MARLRGRHGVEAAPTTLAIGWMFSAAGAFGAETVR
jgi:hypothetical protein